MQKQDYGMGRYPAHLITDGSEAVKALFPNTKSGARKGGDAYKLGRYENQKGAWGLAHGKSCEASEGSASRFFAACQDDDAEDAEARVVYCAKASKADRDSGGVKSSHPTVKPTVLMQYLCRLITPPRGVILDCFMGSGSTGKAAAILGFGFVGIEKDAEYFVIAQKRIEHAKGFTK